MSNRAEFCWVRYETNSNVWCPHRVGGATAIHWRLHFSWCRYYV